MSVEITKGLINSLYADLQDARSELNSLIVNAETKRDDVGYLIRQIKIFETDLRNKGLEVDSILHS